MQEYAREIYSDTAIISIRDASRSVQAAGMECAAEENAASESGR